MANRPDLGISVVVPLYNHEAYIEETLDSVVGQTDHASEIIVLDDGSSDRSYAIAKRFLKGRKNAFVFKQNNKGAHSALNSCIGQAKSPFIAVLNSDDIFKPRKLERCKEILSSRPNTDLIFGRVGLIDHAGKRVVDGPTVDWLGRSMEFLAKAEDLPLALANENFAVTTSNFVFSKAYWERRGGFQALRYCHDLDFLLDAERGAGIFFDNDVEHIRYRLHPNNTIKENLQRIRVEIAAVLANGFFRSVIPAETVLKGETLQLFDKIVTDKGISNLLLFLLASRNRFASREEFYNWSISAIQNNQTMISFLGHSASELAIATAAAPITAEVSGGLVQAHNSIAIAIELSAFDRGGLEKVVLDSAILLRERGFRPIIISCGNVGHLGDIARANQIEVYQLPEDNAQEFYEEVLVDNSVRLAMSHFSRQGYEIFQKLGIPNITFIHNVYAMLNGEALRNFKSDDRFVDAYISVSPRATEYALSRLEVPADKIKTVPNGLIIAEHERNLAAPNSLTRKQFGIGEDDYVFLNVASYNLHKGHYLMAAAMKLVRTRRDDIKILCIGNTIVPDHFTALQDYLAANELTGHILMPGYYPNVADFHRLSDAFILPSLIEGWSIAMNEAMFYGKPLLMTDTGGASEVIENNDIGLLLPNEYGEVANLDSALLDEIGYNRRSFRTAAYLASAMMEFADNRAKWGEAGRKGREKIRERYDFARMVEEYTRIMSNFINR